MSANATPEFREQEVQTRYSELRGMAYLPEDMLGLYVAAPLKRTWRQELFDDETGEAPEFYKVEVSLRYRDTGTTRNDTFVLLTKDVDTAATAIHDWIVHDVRNNPDLDDAQKAAALDFDLTVISGVTIPCYGFIEREFSEVYYAHRPNGLE